MTDTNTIEPRLESLLTGLATRISTRGTRPTRKPYLRRGTPQTRDWRYVAYRYLRRFSGIPGSGWHIGGHHVGRSHFAPGAIGEQPHTVTRRAGIHPALRVDGVPTALEVIR